MHALIVDDSRATRLILKQILHKIGFEVREAQGGREGLEQLNEPRLPDLVLVDRYMPDMDGLDFIRAVRSDARYSDLRVVMVTSEEDPGQVAAALEAGAQEYVCKPFSREGLVEKLELLGLAAHEAMAKIRILIVAGAVVLRRLLVEAFSQDTELEVAGTAATGSIAVARIQQTSPDLLVLDLDMPKTDGQLPLAALHKAYPQLPVVLFGHVSGSGAAADLDPFVLDANDYFDRPLRTADPAGIFQQVRDQLIPRIKQLHMRVRRASKLQAPAGPAPVPKPGQLSDGSGRRVEVVAIGASTGGPAALAQLLLALPAGFPVPVVIVQHMPPVFTQRLAERLEATSAIAVAEARAGAILEPAQAWVAPGDYHLVLGREGQTVQLRTHQAPPENSCRPSVDVLFRSVAEIYGGGALAVVLTGMGQDGLRGCEAIREAGGRVLVQDAASSVVWGMPGTVARAGLADQVVPLEKLGMEIVRRVRRGRSLAAAEITTLH